ncbi:MAG: DUF5753 domain-containing protein [Trebonia sp.]
MRSLYGLTQEKLAAKCHFSAGIVANIESFQRPPLVEHGAAFDEAFGLKSLFATAARIIQEQSFPEAFISFPEHEATADDLYIWEHSLIPGLLQIERYTRAIFDTLPDIAPDEINRRATGRRSRQEILLRKGDGKRPRLWALVDESALYRPVAEATVMHDQCLRLLEISRLPNVSLAVVPYSAGGHVGLAGACTVVEKDGAARIVNMEDLGDGRVTEDPIIVRRVSLRFRLLQHEAMASCTSRDTISRMAEKWKSTAQTGGRVLTAVPREISA